MNEYHNWLIPISIIGGSLLYIGLASQYRQLPFSDQIKKIIYKNIQPNLLKLHVQERDEDKIDRTTLGDDFFKDIITSVLGEDSDDLTDEDYDFIDRCIGVLLGCCCGDILGGKLECHNPRVIVEQLGTVHSFSDLREGKYTDDTEMTVGIIRAINNKNGIISAKEIADIHALAFHERPKRGYGGGAKKLLKDLYERKVNHRNSGTSQFESGSFANGSCMRIHPIGIICRDSEPHVLEKAVEITVSSTHTHEEAIDGAIIQAEAIRYLLKIKDVELFDPYYFLFHLINIAKTKDLITKLEIAFSRLQHHDRDNIYDDCEFNENLSEQRNRYNCMFQIRAVDCMTVCLYCFCKYYKTPEICIQKAVANGGDSDTVAAIVGALCGALHGTSFIPHRWYDNIENDEITGRDDIIQEMILFSQHKIDSLNQIIYEEIED
eukprot:TRINITY_DN2907_c0_g1_i1.p1 TRINITY_DN2907_c0_g1~~TRINITY_DN2907_c0_g1_i1.p1  ORF type:complete len:435 (-),score=145.42 TRINITY_DN2907_c0_g1_i1:108-1412(-)